MHVRITRGVVAARAPRAPGDVLELSAADARYLIATGRAIEAPPAAPKRSGRTQPEQAETDLLEQRSTRG